MFPRSGAPGETDTRSRALTYLLGSPVKEPSFQVPLEGDALFLESSFIRHSKSLVYEAPPPLLIPGSPQT